MSERKVNRKSDIKSLILVIRRQEIDLFSSYRERNQYLPVMMMLRLAIQQGEAYHNEHISMIVHDAQQLYLKKTTIHQINRSVYSYTVAIERYNPTLVSRMNPSHLMREDYISLLKFFETL